MSEEIERRLARIESRLEKISSNIGWLTVLCTLIIILMLMDHYEWEGWFFR